MKIGHFELAHNGALTGTIEHHGARKELTLKPLAATTGPSHEILVSGRRTSPASHVWEAKAGQLRARLTLNNGANTLYLSLRPTGDGGYTIHWQRPSSAENRAARTPERAR
jgi:hypothetical protein